jgi:hypothetical protein
MTEAYFLKFLIPSLIDNKINEMRQKLERLIKEVVNNMHTARIQETSFHSSDYFFISANLARRCMHIPESAIVLAYAEIQPPVGTQKNDTSSKSENVTKVNNVYDAIEYCEGLILSLLKAFSMGLIVVGSLPDSLQTLFIRLIQPLIIGLFGFLSIYFDSTPSLYVIPAFIIVVLF